MGDRFHACRSDASFVSMTNNRFVIPAFFVIPAHLSSRRLCHPDAGGICDPGTTVSSNESIFINALF